MTGYRILRGSGGIIRIQNLLAGKLASTVLLAQEVWMVTVPADAMDSSRQKPTADTPLGNGKNNNAPGV